MATIKNKLLKNLEQDQDQNSMCKSLFTFDVIKASPLLVLVHGAVANRTTISGAILVGDYLQWCSHDGKIK